MYCMYLRKSRKDLELENQGEGETLKRHENILLDLAKKMNISIDKIYKEILSGETISSRPIMQELLRDVEKGLYKGVLVVEVERLARGDNIDQGIVTQAFKYTNTKIITPMKTYDPSNEFDEEYFEFGLFMSRREYKTINRRLQQGRLQSVKEGKYLGTIAPYGYKRVKIQGDKGYTLRIESSESETIKLIYDLYTRKARIGISLIVNKLNEMKVKTKKGGDWTTSTIRDILNNPVYIGKIRWNSRPERKIVVDGGIKKERPRANIEEQILVDGLHESIIDEDTFNLAQKHLAENPSLTTPSRYKVKNPLAGIIICSICGRRMKRKPYKNNMPPTLLCDGPTCTNVSSPLYLVEERLIEALEEWLKEYKLKIKEDDSKDNSIEINIISESINKLNEEIETLSTQMNNLYDLLEQGIYDTDTFINRSKVLKDKIKETENDKRILNNRINDYKAKEENKEKVIPRIENILEVYKRTEDIKTKNELLKEILDKVVYTKEKGGRWSGKIDSFALELYPKLK